MHGPARESAPVSTNLGSMMAYFTDPARFIPTILGPRGWVCSAGIGADGSWNMDIYPRGQSANGPIDIQVNGPGCIGCVYSLVCPLITQAAVELSFPEQCPAERPSRQIVSWIVGSANYSRAGVDVVKIFDPPGVKGYVVHSGGKYASRGMLLYYWGQPFYYDGFPEASGAFNAVLISCVVPNSESSLCQATFSTFRERQWNNG